MQGGRTFLMALQQPWLGAALGFCFRSSVTCGQRAGEVVGDASTMPYMHHAACTCRACTWSCFGSASEARFHFALQHNRAAAWLAAAQCTCNSGHR